MVISCDYHPKKRAHWYCPSCNRNYCSSCAIAREVEKYGTKKIHRLCPQCNTDLAPHSAENIIVPFWRIMHKFFLYPFQLQPLILMLCLSLAFVLTLGPGIVRLLINFALWGVLLKYAFCVLKETAIGSMEPPELSKKNISDNFEIVFKQIAIYVVVGFLFIEVARNAGIVLGLSFLLFAFLSLPAMIIVLIATDSLVAALNPMIFVRVAWRIGWGYVLMYFFYVLLGAAPGTLARFMGHLPPHLALFLLFFIKSYYVIVSYHLMGYVLYQYHEEIGYHVNIEDQSYLKESAVALDEDTELIRRANILLREGKVTEALQLIKEKTAGDIQNVQLADLYYRLLKAASNIEEMVHFGRKYLGLLATNSNVQRQSEIYLDCVSKDKNFPLPPSVAFKVAKFLSDSGKHAEAVGAYNQFIKTNADHHLVPEAYYLAATIINKNFGNPHKALKILKGVVKKYPNHSIIPYVKRYVDTLSAP